MQEDNTVQEKAKRPDGIIIISILWSLAAIYNLYNGFVGVTSNVPLFSYISTGQLSGWFNTAIPSAVVLSTVMMMIAVVQIITCVGLWVGKYHASVAAKIIVTVFPLVNLMFGALYISAPQELGLASDGFMSIVWFGGGAFWAVFYWRYLNRGYVKDFLNK